MTNHDLARRTTFNDVAELYDRARPGYPAAVFDALEELAGIGPGCRVLEIGCGTGQATLLLAQRGCAIVAVELGSALAAVARRKLAAFPDVHVVVSAFEAWMLPETPFDAVVSFTAFHWLDPAVRVAKSADALRPGGALATIATHHVAGGDEAFFVDVQACYERCVPTTPPGLRLPAADAIPSTSDELDRSGRFERVTSRRYEWERTDATAAYLDLLCTYSDIRALEATVRANLLHDIAHLLDSRYGGRVTKRYLTELRIGYRRH